MNVNLILNLVSTLSFSLKFGNDMQINQNYFSFEGDNTSAHMFRDTCTLYLYPRQRLKYSIYHLNVSDSFGFTWEGYLINSTEMKQPSMDKTSFSTSIYHLDLISPIKENKIIMMRPN